ncbi:MAG: hypothetical protein IKC65_04945 [Lentisphaeria bacterium]|nr:hypothetical protein [Lentisphaeria bacterium]
MRAFAAILLTAVFCHALAALSVPNSGFEQVSGGKPSGWGGKGRGELCSQNPRSGKYAYKVTGKANLWAQKLIPVKPGHRYRLSVYSRNTVAAGGCFFGLYESKTPAKLVRSRPLEFKYAVPVGKTWQKSLLEFTTLPATRAICVYVRTECRGPGAVWYDDFALEELGKAPEKLFSIQPFGGAVTFTDHVNALAGKKKGRIYVLPEDPEKMPVELAFPSGVKEGVIDAVLTRGKERVFSQRQKIGGRSMQIRLPLEKLTAGRYVLTVSCASSGKKYQEQREIWRLDRPAAAKSFEKIKSYHIGKDGAFYLNGKRRRRVTLSHFPQVGGFLDWNNPDVRAVVAYAKRDFRIENATMLAWRVQELMHIEKRRKLSRQQLIDAVCKKVKTHLDNSLKSELYISFGLGYLLAPEKPLRDYGLVCEVIKRLKGHPALKSYGFDEPELKKMTPQETAQFYNMVRQLDPSRPCTVNLCEQDTFKEFALSEIASYDHYPWPYSNLLNIRQWNRGIKEAFPGKPFICILQSFSFKGQERPTLDFMRAELFLAMIDGMDGIHFSTWDGGVPHHALNSPEMQAYLKLLFNLEERIFTACDGKAPEKLDFSSSTHYISGARRKDIVLLVNLSSCQEDTVRFKASPGSLSDFTEQNTQIRYENGQAVITLPPWGVAALKAVKK